MHKIITILGMVFIVGTGVAQTPSSPPPEDTSLDLYLDKHLGSNHFYDKYDQPNEDVWHEYVSYEEELSGIDQSTKEFTEQGESFQGLFAAKLQEDVTHADHFWPLAIEAQTLETAHQNFQEKIWEAYQEDITLDTLLNELQTSFGEAETIGEETCEAFDPAAPDGYGAGCFCAVPVLLKDQDLPTLENLWDQFKEGHPYLKVDELENDDRDLEKWLLMTEQEKISIVGGRGDREDALLERVYQTQEQTVQFLAKIMVIKEQIKYLNKTMPKLEKGSVQHMLTQKVKWDDYLDQLLALRRQLESLKVQFEVARRGRSLTMKEPLLYRYDKDESTPEEKVIKSKGEAL